MIKKTFEEFIKQAKELNGNKYDYTKVNYINNKTKITIICKEHGEFLQIPYKHLKGAKCPKCNIIKKNLMQTSTTEKFIKQAKELNGNEYDYTKVNYINNKTKITIICKEHGEFLQNSNKHLRGAKCPKCSIIKKGLMQTSTTEKFIKKAIKIHGYKYDYSKVNYINSNSKIIIICKYHGKFEQLPSNHINKRGCIKCGKNMKLFRKNNII
jgi:Zn ribbon nucleic-acid-binding protein